MNEFDLLGHAPADLAWWLVGLLATQLYRVRRRAMEAESSEAAWKKAAEQRGKRSAELVAEVVAERARTDALHRELINLNHLLHTMRNDT